MRRLVVVLAFVTFAAAFPGCSRDRTYELRGQVIAVDPAREELTVKHEDITGFMPGMTMQFKVRPGASVKDRKPGDLIRATLVVGESTAYLRDVRAEGHAPIPEGTAPGPAVDLLRDGDEVPDGEFTDDGGTPRRLSDWRSRIVAVTFTYTRCPMPDFCPLMDRHFATLQREVQDDAVLRGRVQLLSITIDPAYDTPAVLAKHAARVGADPAVWRFLSGEPKAVQAFAARFGVSASREDPASPELLHNLRTAVIDRRGQVAKILTGNTWKPAELIEAIRDADAVR